MLRLWGGGTPRQSLSETGRVLTRRVRSAVWQSRLRQLRAESPSPLHDGETPEMRGAPLARAGKRERRSRRIIAMFMKCKVLQVALDSAVCHQQRKQTESPACPTSVPSATATTFDRSTFRSYTSSTSSSSPSPASLHQHSSSTLPHQSSSHVHPSPHYSTSSLPHMHTSLSLGQPSSPSIFRSSRSRTSCIPPTPAPTAPLPVCPSPQTGIRYVSPSC
ncbi:uncharacterized protein LOC142881685 [Nelusetta ayraudi]|uniref:uncharacterized protein LOC142881685 n=1 Tax=Nelusetta ayraudi TaxID=303726 RepID=UPI003F712248